MNKMNRIIIVVGIVLAISAMVQIGKGLSHHPFTPNLVAVRSEPGP